MQIRGKLQHSYSFNQHKNAKQISKKKSKHCSDEYDTLRGLDPRILCSVPLIPIHGGVELGRY